MSDWPSGERPPQILISPVSDLALGVEYAALAAAVPASAQIATVNLSRAYPFVLPEPILVRKVWWMNGATANGNTDVGVYTEDGTLIVSSGARAQSGTSVLQEWDITDTMLGRGRYYCAISTSSATATYFSHTLGTGGLQFGKLIGWAQMATAHPLPATYTFAAAAAAVFPVFGISGRTLVT